MVTIGANRTFWTVKRSVSTAAQKTQLEWPLARLCFRNRLVVVPFFNIAGDKGAYAQLEDLNENRGKARFMPDARFEQIVEKIKVGARSLVRVFSVRSPNSIMQYCKRGRIVVIVG